jgi:exonuclease SbcC
MKIKKVEIEAFRAYKAKEDGTFDFTTDGETPSNFVAIYAPNGFGKSSFYDAVEWAVTNHMERLGGEYNKSNFESAARITKDASECQKILRNKYVSDDVLTKVVVSTTRPEPFERELPKTRANGRDLRFGDHSRKENDFFRRVILSQDEIDRFLREAKPQERYAKFMESFGGDIEVARKELSILITDNKAELNSLSKQKEPIIEVLNQPIDTSVFERFNSVAEELNALGENIILPDKNYSSESEHALNAYLISRQHELNLLSQSNYRVNEVLVDRLARTSEIKNCFVSQEEQSPNLIRLSKGVADASKYQNLLELHDKCLADQQNTHKRLTNIIDITKNREFFFQVESRLLEISARQKTLTNDHTKSSAQLSGLELTLRQLDAEIKSSDDRGLLLRKTVDNATSIYTELSIHKNRVSALGLQISERETEIQIDNAKLLELNRELVKLSGLKISSDLLSAKDEGVLLLGREKIEKLTRCYADLDLITVQNQAINTTQQALTEQMASHERIIAMGLDYISQQSSNICPLCTMPHLSVDALLSKVKGQNLLSDLSQENSKKLSFFATQQKELRNSIQEITQQAVEAQVQRLNILNKKTKEIQIKLVNAKREQSGWDAEYKILKNRIEVLESSVWALPYDELNIRVSAELESLSTKCTNLLEQRTVISAEITQLTNSLKTKESELQTLASEFSSISNDPIYIAIREYLNENAIDSSVLKNHCTNKQIELDAEILRLKCEVESLASQCNDLQKEMKDNETWIDFSQLKLQKESLEVTLSHYQSTINSFYESLSHIINIHTEDTIEKVIEHVKLSIENSRLRAIELDKLSNGIKLLLELMVLFRPYIKHISLREELALLEKSLDERQRVDIALTSERDTIVKKLEILINNFFYEELINAIYRKIDPHPAFKKVEFKADFESDKPGLNIIVSDSEGKKISPILYFSAAQTNILSLSIFLASALHAKDDNGEPVDVVMIDDPIQSMDSINILSTIDLLRSICLQFDKQVIISTHDENFFGLLQRKIPAQIIGSRFLQLEKFGVVVPVEPFKDYRPDDTSFPQ